MNKTTVIILAAGNSERMGKAKSQLQFNSKYTFLDQLISQYHFAGLKRIIVVSQFKEASIKLNHQMSVEFMRNSEPEKGRAWSIYLGLQQVGNAAQVFIQNIDNPFTDQFLIQEMMKNSSPEHVIYPSYRSKKAHPVLIPQFLVQQILENDFATFDFKESLSLLPSKLVSCNDSTVLANINKPEDYLYWFGHEVSFF